VREFFRLEAASGIVLLACAVAALAWANLDPRSYHAVLEHPLRLGAGARTVEFTVHGFVSDALMTVFFFVVGMEIKRELSIGELRTPGQALLPLVAAAGGMLLPALIYVAFNAGGPGAAGWGIPVATDIAFCIGVLTLLRGRVPRALVVFLTALAIFDDIGGILVIALFYGSELHALWLAGAAGVTLVLVAMSRLHVQSGLAYLVAGVALWIAFHEGGIHATVAGVVLGLTIPARARTRPGDVLAALGEHLAALDRGRQSRDEELDADELRYIDERISELQPPLDRFVDRLHPWVAYGVMPLFALANAGVVLGGAGASAWLGPVAVGTALGLLVGKAVGIFLFALLVVWLGVARIPADAGAAKLLGVSTVGGIGFTVALFIASLAFPSAPELLDQAKVGVLAGSLAAGLAGAALLLRTRPLGVKPAADGPALESSPPGLASGRAEDP
jgi:NhaA family Na+:H+ antiporter